MNAANHTPNPSLWSVMADRGRKPDPNERLACQGGVALLPSPDSQRIRPYITPAFRLMWFTDAPKIRGEAATLGVLIHRHPHSLTGLVYPRKIEDQ